MIDARARSEDVLGEAKAAAGEPRPAETEGFLEELVDWLARVRLLDGVPFSYVVPHEAMLPLESIRFFYLNRGFLDAAVDGALSVAGATTRDHAYLTSVHQELVEAVDEAERNLWSKRLGVELHAGVAETVTGFLLRSRLVAGWPGLSVRAFRAVQGGEESVQLLRMERLAPGVLLVLMDGVPDRLELEEPRGGLQFGVDTKVGSPNKRTVTIRHPVTGADGATVDVPFRAGAPGVVDMIGLRDRLLASDQGELGPTLSPAELGLQVLQYPTRQEFRDTGPAPDVFRPNVDLSHVEKSQGGA
jgi:hypothetical protein